MKKLLILAAFAAIAGMIGCKSIEVEYRGKNVATLTDTNGVVRAVCDELGKPIFYDKGWVLDYFCHGTFTEFDQMHASVGSLVFDMNGYRSDVSSNFVGIISASFDGGARLATAIGDAYCKIAGGGAQASTVLSTSRKILEYFKSKGGDAAKASVTTDGTLLKVSDGNTCVSCDAAGNCADCKDS